MINLESITQKKIYSQHLPNYEGGIKGISNFMHLKLILINSIFYVILHFSYLMGYNLLIHVS